MLNYISCLVLLVVLQAVLGEVTILKSVQTIYNRSPKLRIRGSGFDVDDHDIIIEIGAQGDTPLKVEKDFLVTKDDDGVILKLLGNRKWVNMDNRTPPVALILSGVKFANNPTKNLLIEPVIVAQVLITPTITPSSDVIYTTATNELRLNGTGFIGAKKVDLYFNPPLYKEIAYEVVSKFPVTKNEIVLRLRHGYKWREEPGPLMLVGVDTGGGPARVGGDEGILVAEVQADLDLHGVTVESTAAQQFVYHDEPNIIISGTGFNPSGNTLRFANGIIGKGVNFTTVSTSNTSISLRLTPGSGWRKNVENLPGFLTLLAVNAGEGFVAVGPTNAAKGRDVATVFERPQVFSSNTKLFRTHSHELHIKGTGFPKVITKPQLKFMPELIEGVDYKITVLDRTEMELTLIDGRAWRSTPGPLQLTFINTRGDEAGWIDLAGDGIHVAEIVADIDADTTGGVEVFPMGVKVYQSALQQPITITGKGFKKPGIAFTFTPDLKQGSDYDMDIQSDNKIVLKLRSSKSWKKDGPGFIIAKSVIADGKTYPLAGNDGIRVAVVLSDPIVTPAKESYHESQSKVIAVSGHGFTTMLDTKLVIRPTAPGAYKILGVSEDTIRVQLKPGNDWLPSFLSLKDASADHMIPLQVAGIDTGAGEIVFSNPITIGNVIKDREGVTCDDSCEFAFDGTCDDGSQDLYYYYYQEKFNYYQDDDLGGYYSSQSSYGAATDDYYMEDDGYKVSACVEGTDCTDCGGVDAIVDYSSLKDPEVSAKAGIEACVNTCPYARDGICDDPRGANYCKLGTDCQDCGPVGFDNFTHSDDSVWDDDDDYFKFNDGNFLEQAAGLEANREHVKKRPVSVAVAVVEAGAFAVLGLVEIAVITGAILSVIIAIYVTYKWYHSQAIPFIKEFDPEATEASSILLADFKEASSKKYELTPDVIRT